MREATPTTPISTLVVPTCSLLSTVLNVKLPKTLKIKGGGDYGLLRFWAYRMR
jgi:hypothetical protein